MWPESIHKMDGLMVEGPLYLWNIGIIPRALTFQMTIFKHHKNLSWIYMKTFRLNLIQIFTCKTQSSTSWWHLFMFVMLLMYTWAMCFCWQKQSQLAMCFCWQKPLTIGQYTYLLWGCQSLVIQELVAFIYKCAMGGVRQQKLLVVKERKY